MTISGSDAQTEAGPDLAGPAEAVEQQLRSFLAGRDLPGNLRDAIAYALMGGGKRLRPILAQYACEAVGADRAEALPAGAAIELIHAFSLVHDDLPAMDDDDLRRGRPTLHKHANEAMAILAGDAMIVLAFQLLSRSVGDAAKARRLTSELAEAGSAMIAGQVYDTLPDEAELAPIDRLQRIHRHKTAALIRAACRCGAISGGASEARLAALSEFGESIGLMFQAVDDLLDVTESTEAVGKTTQKDAQQGKLTYPGLLGVEATREEVDRLRAAAHEALSDFDEAADPLRQLCDYMARRKK